MPMICMASELIIETEGRSKYLQLGKFKPPVVKMLGDTLDTGSVLHETVIQTHALTLLHFKNLSE